MGHKSFNCLFLDYFKFFIKLLAFCFDIYQKPALSQNKISNAHS